MKSYQTLKDELDDLMINKRRAVSVRICDARKLGDLSDNPEYDTACEERRKVEARIDEIKETLKIMKE